MTVRILNSSYICNKCKFELDANEAPDGWRSLEFWEWQSTDESRVAKDFFKDLCPPCATIIESVLENQF